MLVKKSDIGFFSVPIFNAITSLAKIIIIMMFAINTSMIAQIENISMILEMVSFALISPLFFIFKKQNKNLNSNIFLKSITIFLIFSLLIIFLIEPIQNVLNIKDMTTFLRIAVIGIFLSFILTFLQTMISVNKPEILLKLAAVKTFIAILLMITLFSKFGEFGVLYAEISINFICIIIAASICIKENFFEIKNIKNEKINLLNNSGIVLVQTIIDTTATVFFLKAYINKISFAGDFWFMDRAITMAYFLIINGFCEKIKSVKTEYMTRKLLTNILKIIILITLLMPLWINLGYLLGLPKENTQLFILFALMSMPKMITSLFYSWFISSGKQIYTIFPAIVNLIVCIIIFTILNRFNIFLNYYDFLIVYGILLSIKMLTMVLSYIFCIKQIKFWHFQQKISNVF